MILDCDIFGWILVRWLIAIRGLAPSPALCFLIDLHPEREREVSGGWSKRCRTSSRERCSGRARQPPATPSSSPPSWKSQSWCFDWRQWWVWWLQQVFTLSKRVWPPKVLLFLLFNLRPTILRVKNFHMFSLGIRNYLWWGAHCDTHFVGLVCFTISKALSFKDKDHL